MDQGRIITSVKSFKASTCKNDNRHERLPASVLGTVFRCLALGFIQVCYGFFCLGIYRLCTESACCCFWALETSRSSIFCRLPFSELGSPARKQVWKGSETGSKHLGPTLQPLCSSIHQSYTFGNMLINLCAQVMFSQDPSVYSWYSMSTEPHVFQTLR